MASDRVISADCHMDMHYLPSDTFESRVEASWRDRVPRVTDIDGDPWWTLQGNKFSMFPAGRYGPGVTGGQRANTLVREGFASGEIRPSNHVLRREDAARDGVDAELLYGIASIYRDTNDMELVAVMFRAYNEWVAEFCAKDPKHFGALACLPSHTAEAATAELRHAAELGLKGGLMAPYTAVMPMWHEMWEPLWAAAEETGLPMHFHTFGGATGGTSSVGFNIKGEANAASAGSYITVAPLQLDEVMASMLLCGALERHPGLRVVLGESGIGWVAYMLERIDITYEDRLSEDLNLPKMPSEYFKRQMHAVFLKDHMGVRLMAEIAPDNVMWGNDYPHRDGTWPDSQAVLKKQFAGIEPSIKQKFLCDTAASLYRF